MGAVPLTAAPSRTFYDSAGGAAQHAGGGARPGADCRDLCEFVRCCRLARRLSRLAREVGTGSGPLQRTG
eukprot:1731868-Prymnesium_polylepis.2